MAKKKKNNTTQAAKELESNIAPILELDYTDPIFTISSHPSKPLLLSGLATGHVYLHKYNDVALEDMSIERLEKKELIEKEAMRKGKIASVNKSIYQTKTKWWDFHDAQELEDAENVSIGWKTKRHKGSCRSVIFDATGDSLFSVGTDKIIKKASSETGKVIVKTNTDLKSDITKLIGSTTHPFLVAGTESGNIYVYDSNDLKSKFNIPNVHDDAVNSIVAMPSVSPYHFLSVGSTTLTHIDIRKGIITKSDDQEDEVLSICFPDNSTCDTAICGMGEGVVTIWKDKNRFSDQLTRVKVSKDNSIDCVISTMDNERDEGDCVWAGSSDGILNKVDVRKGKLTETRVHDLKDEVGMLDIDFDYRLISAGMEKLKIWSNRELEENDWEDLDSDKSDDDSDIILSGNKSDNESLSDLPDDVNGSDIGSGSDLESLNASDFDSDDPGDSESEDEAKEAPVLVKRKRFESDPVKSQEEIIEKPKKVMKPVKPSKPARKTIDLNKETKKTVKEVQLDAEPLKKKSKTEIKLTGKQLRNLQNHEHGIKKFDDL